MQFKKYNIEEKHLSLSFPTSHFDFLTHFDLSAPWLKNVDPLIIAERTQNEERMLIAKMAD